MSGTRDRPAGRVFEGGCHCGAVAFEVTAEAPLRVQQCNCSICELTGYQHLIVPAGRFRLLRGEDVLTEYRFNTGTARHLFCSVCGIKSFYVPRSNPDGYSVNLRCLRGVEAGETEIESFDGRNWEAHAEALAHLSRA
jgi:hypothetical protein